MRRSIGYSQESVVRYGSGTVSEMREAFLDILGYTRIISN